MSQKSNILVATHLQLYKDHNAISVSDNPRYLSFRQISPCLPLRDFRSYSLSVLQSPLATRHTPHVSPAARTPLPAFLVASRRGHTSISPPPQLVAALLLSSRKLSRQILSGSDISIIVLRYSEYGIYISDYSVATTPVGHTFTPDNVALSSVSGVTALDLKTDAYTGGNVVCAEISTGASFTYASVRTVLQSSPTAGIVEGNFFYRECQVSGVNV